MKHIKGETEIIVGLDGWTIDYEMRDHPLVRYFISEDSIGQRAMTNKLAEMSDAKYVMKLDAHCSMSDGFDVRMMNDMADFVTLVPALANLHAYDWVCKDCGIKYYQREKPTCEVCKRDKMIMERVWDIKPKPMFSEFFFDPDLVFQFGSAEKAEILSETMAIQGSGFMIERERYWDLNICDEAFGSWGQQGVEVALKSWLSGGMVIATRKAFMGHLFRTNEQFPYERDMKQVEHAYSFSKDLFLGNKWPRQVISIQTLIKSFGYPCGWDEEKVSQLSTLNSRVKQNMI